MHTSWVSTQGVNFCVLKPFLVSNSYNCTSRAVMRVGVTADTGADVISDSDAHNIVTIHSEHHAAAFWSKLFQHGMGQICFFQICKQLVKHHTSMQRGTFKTKYFLLASSR